jgi:hypothetical protein
MLKDKILVTARIQHCRILYAFHACQHSISKEVFAAIQQYKINVLLDTRTITSLLNFFGQKNLLHDSLTF